MDCRGSLREPKRLVAKASSLREWTAGWKPAPRSTIREQGALPDGEVDTIHGMLVAISDPVLSVITSSELMTNQSRPELPVRVSGAKSLATVFELMT